jgi:small subunit ribosomal protein S2
MGRNNNGVLSIHKKEASSLRRELEKLQKNLGGVADMDSKPGAMIVVDICREQNAVAEATRLGIPIVAIVDTNADPDPIEHVIPGNDDAVRGIKLIVDAFAKVMKEANDEYQHVAAERQRQRDAEQVQSDAQDKVARKVRRDKDEDDDAGKKAKTRLMETRKKAAKAAKDATIAKAASVEAVPADEASAEAVEAPAAE